MHEAPKKAISRQRARSVQDKDLRRAHLVQAAAQLFADADFDGVTIAQVAQTAGVAKGTAYIYFPTKEALFLELVRAELSTWLEQLERSLRRVRAHDRVQSVSTILARCVSQRPTLWRLLILLHSVIEPKIDEGRACDFKFFLLDLLSRAGNAIASKIPGLQADQAVTVVLQLHALVIGLAQLANPPPVIAQVLAQNPALQAMQIDFEPFLMRSLVTLLRGTVAGAPTGAHIPLNRC